MPGGSHGPRLAFPREEGRGFSQHLALLAQDAVLAAELRELLALVASHAGSAAEIDLSLLDPVAERLLGAAEILRDPGRSARPMSARARSPRGETPADTAVGCGALELLSRTLRGPVVKCPRNRGKSRHALVSGSCGDMTRSNATSLARGVRSQLPPVGAFWSVGGGTDVPPPREEHDAKNHENDDRRDLPSGLPSWPRDR